MDRYKIRTAVGGKRLHAEEIHLEAALGRDYDYFTVTRLIPVLVRVAQIRERRIKQRIYRGREQRGLGGWWLLWRELLAPPPDAVKHGDQRSHTRAVTRCHGVGRLLLIHFSAHAHWRGGHTRCPQDLSICTRLGQCERAGKNIIDFPAFSSPSVVRNYSLCRPYVDWTSTEPRHCFTRSSSRPNVGFLLRIPQRQSKL